MAQKERENFYRISTVIVDHGKESLVAVLENDLANTKLTLEDFINRHQHDIYHLCYNKSSCCQCPTGRFVPANTNRVLNPAQLDLLLDTSGPTLNGHNPNTSRTFQHCCRPAKKSLSSSILDITLLRCLLKNFATNYRTNSILRRDIEDLVESRNKLYGHAQEARLSDADYTKYKSDVEGIILRIARFCNIENEMKQKLNDVSQRPLDEAILVQYQITLLQQSLNYRNIEEKVDQVQHYLTAQEKRQDCRMGILESKISEVGHRKRNIIVQTEAQLLEHFEDDTYVITEDVELCCKILEEYNALVIISKAGGGKSKTCLQIAIEYQAKLYTPMLFVNNEITRNRDLIDFDDNNIVIVEDLFGRSNVEFNEDLHRGILDVLYSCIKTESCKSKWIITIRGDEEINRKIIGRHRLFEKDILINLDKIRNRHSKKLILSKHMNKHDIISCNCGRSIFGETFYHPVEIEQCSSEVVETSNNSMQLSILLIHNICDGKYEMQIGFPQACHLFCSNKNLTKQGMTYFTHTSQSLVDEIDALKIEGFHKKVAQYQYCILVYIAMKTVFAYDDIDEICFHKILSLIYNEQNVNDKINRSLLKAAVLVLEGTYIRQQTARCTKKLLKRPKGSANYVLQHNTIKEAVIISYGDDANVLIFCDFSFLLEYIRPKDYKDDLSNSMVILYTDYKLLVKRLLDELLINENLCTFVGMYLQVVALLHRRNEIIQVFFEKISAVRPEQYTGLFNGLTSFGNNADFVVFHPQLFKQCMIHFSVKVFLKFCRPVGWAETNASFVQIETELMIEKLYLMVALNNPTENEQNPTKNKNEYHSISFLFPFPEKTNAHYDIGNYVFQNLIEKGFLSIVNSLFTKLKQNEKSISPINIKDFLDGLLNDGKRSSIVSQFKDFFNTILFKYGSIPTILQLCRPLTVTCSQNVIQVDDRLLIGKICAHFEDISRVISHLHTAVPREDDTYFVYFDLNYIHGFYINDIAEFIFEHGVKLNNDKFVRTMYDQLVSDKEQMSDGEESVNDFESTPDMSDDRKNRDECKESTSDMSDDRKNRDECKESTSDMSDDRKNRDEFEESTSDMSDDRKNRDECEESTPDMSDDRKNRDECKESTSDMSDDRKNRDECKESTSDMSDDRKNRDECKESTPDMSDDSKNRDKCKESTSDMSSDRKNRDECKESTSDMSDDRKNRDECKESTSDMSDDRKNRDECEKSTSDMSDDRTNRDECKESTILNGQKIIFDDYPDDENEKIVQIKVDVGFVKRVYIENSLSIHAIPLDRHLVDFLYPFNDLTEKWLSSGISIDMIRMAILHFKFNKLLERMMHE